MYLSTFITSIFIPIISLFCILLVYKIYQTTIVFSQESYTTNDKAVNVLACITIIFFIIGQLLIFQMMFIDSIRKGFKFFNKFYDQKKEIKESFTEIDIKESLNV